jgi:hypothetical protein
MALTGLRGASSWEPALGSTVLDGWGAGVGLTDGMVVRGTEIRAGGALGAIAADTTVVEAGVIVAAMLEADTRTGTQEAAFTVERSGVGRSAEVGSTAERSMGAEAFMAEAASTVVAAMAADIGNVLNG